MSEHERVPLQHLRKFRHEIKVEDIPEGHRTFYFYRVPLKKEVLKANFTLVQALRSFEVCRYFHGFVYNGSKEFEMRLAVRPTKSHYVDEPVFEIPAYWCTTEEEAFQKLNNEVNNKKELLNRKIERVQTRLRSLEHYHSLLLQKR
jgi:hypothetical protein